MRALWLGIVCTAMSLWAGASAAWAQSSPASGQGLQSPAILATAVARDYVPQAPPAIGPLDYPYGVNPLTGYPYPSVEALERRNLIVKISNWPPRVRPQHGVNQADLVFEYEAEGGVTRFAGIYRSQAPRQVGSVRSARLLDIELLTMYAALLAYSGSSEPIEDIYLNAPFRPLLLSPSLGDNCDRGGFCRDNAYRERGYEHTMFGDTRTMWELASRRNINTGYRANGFAFALELPSGGVRAEELFLDWYQRTQTLWQYDDSRQRYLRYADGVPQIDAIDGSQLYADNLIIIEAAHNRRPDLFQPGAIDESYEVALWGRGPAVVLRNGRQFHGNWWRRDQSRGTALQLHFDDGTPIHLQPGRSWITVLRDLAWADIRAERGAPPGAGA